MRGLIFAAGLGTRLRPITNDIPKALVKVNGKPLLEHTIERLKGAGIDKIVINVHHFSNKIIDFLASKNNFGIDISISNESDMLRDTGGGIKYAQRYLNNSNEPFLVHNVDILSNLDITEFYKVHNNNSKAEGALATLLVSNRATSRYLLFNSNNRLVGWMNIDSGEVKSPYPHLKRESSTQFNYNNFLKEHNLQKYAFAGIHYINSNIFNIFTQWPDKFSIIDFYLSVLDKYPIICYPKSNLELIDVGKIDTLKTAEQFLNR